MATKTKTKAKCKWCGRSFDPKTESESFCSENPNRQKAVDAFYNQSPKYKRIRKGRKKDLEGLVTTPCIVLPQREFPR